MQALFVASGCAERQWLAELRDVRVGINISPQEAMASVSVSPREDFRRPASVEVWLSG